MGLENKQKLNKEQWTRIIRIGEGFVGEARLQPILPDMQAFYQKPPEHVSTGKKSWALLFNPKDCNMKYAEQTIEQMMIKDTILRSQAMVITELREKLRLLAATVAQ